MRFMNCLYLNPVNLVILGVSQGAIRELPLPIVVGPGCGLGGGEMTKEMSGGPSHF